MRLADDLTDSSGDNVLPAPSGLPAPAGQSPVEPPPHLTSDPTVPAGPRLPPRPSRTTTAPPTGQVPAIVAAALTLANTTAPAEEAPPPKRSHKRRRIILASVLVVVVVTSVAMRSTSFGERFTGSGYDTNPLPLHAIAEPPFTGADYTITYQSVAIDNGLATNFWNIEHDEVNYTTKIAKATMDQAKASIVGGTIGTPQSTSPPSQVMIDDQSTYEQGATPQDAWVRSPTVASNWSTVLNRGDVYMYQDVIDPPLRARHPAKVVDEVRHGVPVTTYTYTFAFGDFYETAPRLFDLVKIVDGNAADDADVKVTVSFDGQWMVRYLDVNVDHDAVLDHRARVDAGIPYPYRFTVDLNSVTDTPESLSVPTNVVDAPVEESTTIPTTTTVVTP